MSRAPRGTLAWLEHRDGEGRGRPWGVCWNEYDPGRLRKRPRSKWYASEAEARAVLSEVLAQLAGTAPAPVDPGPVKLYAKDSFGALAPTWLAWVKAERAAATWAGYDLIVRQYLAPAPGHAHYPGIGDLVVSDATFKPHVIAAYLATLKAAGIPLSRRHSIKRAIGSFCMIAKDLLGVLTFNPTIGMGRSLMRGKGEAILKAEPNPFTADDVTRFLDQIAAVEPEWSLYFLFLLDAGVRVGEAAALQWDRVDLVKRKATIAAAYCRHSQADKEPKTHEVRTIDLTTRWCERAAVWQATQRREAFRRGVKVPGAAGGYVFTTGRLARMLPARNARVFHRTLAAIAAPGDAADPVLQHTPHDLRDTFATAHLIANWTNLPRVSRQLGHASTVTTQEHYFRYVEERKAAGFVDDIARIFGT